MKELLLICVIYNSYKELEAYMASICRAKRKSCNTNITVYIADNSSQFQEVNIEKYPEINAYHVRFDNLGYMGAAQSVVNNMVDISYYDFLIISNVDILMDDLFIAKLESMDVPKYVGWIAPSIKSNYINRDKNPSILLRYPKWKLELLKLTYNSFVLPLYEKLYYNVKKQKDEYKDLDIYAGHGSFFLFTRSFINNYPKLDYPIFLYGEELYFAELNRKAGLKVRYIPSLIINDFEHVSTSLIRRRQFK